MGVRSTNPSQSFIDDFYRSGTDAATNLPSVKATGGDAEFTDGGYEYHVFTTPGPATLVVNRSANIEYILSLIHI